MLGAFPRRGSIPCHHSLSASVFGARLSLSGRREDRRDADERGMRSHRRLGGVQNEFSRRRRCRLVRDRKALPANRSCLFRPLGNLRTDHADPDHDAARPKDYSVRIALIPLGLAAAINAWRVRHVVDREHIRGLRLLRPKDHHRQVHAGWLEGYRNRSGITVGASLIAPRKEAEHFLITGSPGAGKSTLIRHMLVEIRERKTVGDRDRSGL